MYKFNTSTLFTSIAWVVCVGSGVAPGGVGGIFLALSGHCLLRWPGLLQWKHAGEAPLVFSGHCKIICPDLLQWKHVGEVPLFFPWHCKIKWPGLLQWKHLIGPLLRFLWAAGSSSDFDKLGV